MVRFTVITVAKNAAATIGKTVHSVARQILKGIDFLELLIVDGASTDGTLSTIQETLGNCPAPSEFHCRTISQPDSGIYEAMNWGLSLAQGDYVLFLNSDDTFYDDQVLATVAVFALRSPECDLWVGDIAVQSPLRSEHAVVSSAQFFLIPS
ncbi:MAG: glycosyltransferase [Oscillatoriales cyanobacterium SM2_2_1]|nr:glycosyltransferase [Oscillatoriales cyanobacterium SM2_2_1]